MKDFFHKTITKIKTFLDKCSPLERILSGVLVVLVIIGFAFFISSMKNAKAKNTVKEETQILSFSIESVKDELKYYVYEIPYAEYKVVEEGKLGFKDKTVFIDRGVLKFYVDVSDLPDEKIQIDEKSKTITLILPDISVQPELHPNESESETLRNSRIYNSTDYSLKIHADIEETVIEKYATEENKEKAREILQNQLEKYISIFTDGYSIKLVWENDIDFQG